jgi:hypothetical protein
MSEVLQVEAVQAVVAWFGSDEGRAAVHRVLVERGLADGLADDLRQDVLVDLLAARTAIANPIGFASTALRRRATDRLRAFRRAATVTLDPYEDTVVDPAPGPEALAGDVGPAVRTRLAGAVPVRARSAALTAVTVAVDDPPLPQDCPQPGQGASASDAALWTGVWFAGGADLWPGATPAARKQRSRLVAEARAVLAAALEEPAP